jgi:hypothetical protein
MGWDDDLLPIPQFIHSLKYHTICHICLNGHCTYTAVVWIMSQCANLSRYDPLKIHSIILLAIYIFSSPPFYIVLWYLGGKQAESTIP